MPTVPQYQRQVTPQVIPNEYIRLDANPNMFGANIAQAQGNVGKAMGEFGDAMLKIKDRIDDTNILEMVNKSSEWEQKNLYDKENGYFFKNGKDAYGKSEELLKDYDDYMKDFMKGARFTGDAARRARETYLRKRDKLTQDITNYDYKQGIAWSNTEAETAKNNYITTAINSRNNPEEISKALMSGYQAIEWQGELQHQDEATINLQKMQYRSNLHEAVLNAYLADGSLRASQYLEEHKGEINPDKLPSYIDAVKNNELTYTARSIAYQYVGQPLETVYKEINSIADPKTRDAVMKEWSVLNNQREAVQREKDAKAADDIMQQVFQFKDSGKSLSEIMTIVNAADMSAEMKFKMLDNLKKMQEAEQYGDSWVDYNYLRDLASTDHEKFLEINPAIYNLTKTQYDDIKELQRKGKDIPYSSEIQLEKIAKEFDENFNWFTQHDLDGGEYKRELIDFLSLLERKQGRAFDINNINEGQLAAIAAGLGYKNPLEKNKNIDEVKELWMRAKKHGDFKAALVSGYQSFKTINKREPQPEEMYELAKRSYNWIETEYQQRGKDKLTNQTTLYNNIINTNPKTGETKALTYLADTTIPAIGRKLGVKYTYVKGARYRKGDSGNHGKGLSLDVSMSEHSELIKVKSYEEFAALPHVKTIGTSDPILLKQYAGTAKIKDLTAYDKTHGTNHKNHMHITIDERYGGKEQGK